LNAAFQNIGKGFIGFAKKYDCTRLVYYEHHRDILHAIEREKQLKKWRREKKEKLIRMKNPPWKDLSADWFDGKRFKMTKDKIIL
jgi:putative endonuclease